MGKVVNIFSRRTKENYDYHRIASILARKKIEHRSDIKMLRNFIRDLKHIESKPDLVKDIWKGLAYRYIKKDKVFAYSERDLENNENVEEVLLGGISFSPVPKIVCSNPKYLFRAEAEYMEIRRLASDIFSIVPDLLTEGMDLNFSTTVIAGYFKMEDALLMDLDVLHKDSYSLVRDFVKNKYRLDAPKQNSVYYVIARCLYSLHTGVNPADIEWYKGTLVNLSDYFRVWRYIDNKVKVKHFVQSNGTVVFMKSDKGEEIPSGINTTLLLHDLLLTLDMKELANSCEVQKPIYLGCYGTHKLEEDEDECVY